MAQSAGRLLGVIAVVAGLVMMPVTAAGANPLRTGDYPSWDDVQAAKQSEAGTQAEADRITALLDGLEATATQLSNEALKRGEEYLVASYNRDAAQATADDLKQRARAAAAAADKAKRQVGTFVAQLYKSGGGDSTVNLLVSGDDADTLLYRLGAMSKLTEQTTGLRDAALIASNNASSLQGQAASALTERDRLSAEAERSLQSAKDAQAAAEAQVAEQRARSSVLYEQLASLKNSTAQLEQAYRDGVAAEAEKKRRQDAATPSSGTGSSWVPDSGSVASPEEAQAIAASLLPDYGWGGDQFSCLVRLWTGESDWRVNAYNPDSGAYGIPQSWPANKMSSVADDWETNAQTQIIWGLRYISSAYGSPCSALGMWLSRSPHWY